MELCYVWRLRCWAASPAAGVAGYGDVAEGAYYTDPVQWSVDNNITGIDGDCFLPDAPVSRGETALYIWNMQGQPTAAAHPFTDVTVESQNAAISWMAESGITTGTSTTTFGPEATLTRAQVAAFLHRLAGKPAAAPHPFTDVVAGWQQAPVSWMATSGITTGTSPTTFSPDATLTRAQLITFLYRYQNKPAVTINPHTPTCDPEASVEPDDESVAVGFGSASYSVLEGGSVAVEVVLDTALEQPVTIPVTATGAGGATTADFWAPSSVTLASGVTSQTFILFAYSDEVADNGENVVLAFGGLPSGVVEGSVVTTTVQIVDDPITDTALDSPINIPDANFKAALLKLFNKSATQQITVRDARSITSLNISSLEISDLTGLEHFINLVSLNVSGNELASLVLPSLPKLTYLDLRSNELAAISLGSSSLPALRELYLSGNEIVELVLDGFPQLSTVDLRHNALESLVLRNVGGDTIVNSTLNEARGGWVTVLGNPLKSFTAVNLPALASVYLGELGTLESVTLSDLPELTGLWVQNNVLSGLVLPSLPKLRWLHASNNALTAVSLESSNLPALEVLDLSDNQIVEMVLDGFPQLSLGSSSLPALRELYLSGNEIVELVLDGFPQLSTVDLRHNALESLVLRNVGGDTIVNSTLNEARGGWVTVLGNPLKSFTAVNLPALASVYLGELGTLESVTLSDLPELTGLWVQNNVLSGLVLPSLPKLRWLHASNNALTAVSLESSNLPALEVLDLSDNQIVEMVLDGFPQLSLGSSSLPALRELYLSGNEIVELVLDGFPQLSTVDLRHNALESLVLRNVGGDTIVNSTLNEARGGWVTVLGNPLKSFTAVNLPALASVYLGELGTLESVTLSDLPELTGLWVQNNVLSGLVLPSLPKLRWLHASNNALTAVSLESSNLPALEVLDLSDNQIVEMVLDGFPQLSLGSSSLPALRELYLSGNEIVELVLDGFPQLSTVDLRHNALESLVLRNVGGDTIVNSTLNEARGGWVTVLGNPLKSFTAVNLPALASVYLGELGTLESVTLSDLPELTGLWVQNNVLSGLVLPSLPKLRWLHASNNALTAVSLESSNLPALEVLDLSDNQIVEMVLDGFPQLSLGSSSLPALRELYLSGNEIVELVLDGFPQLSTVDLRHNALESLVLRNVGGDTIVNSTLNEARGGWVTVLGNPLKSFTAVNLPALASVYLGELGTLESVTLSDLPELTGLWVQNNVLSGLVLPSLPKLRWLHASNNALTAVSLESSNLPALEVLDLSDNQIVEMVLDGFPQLSLVDLRNNALEALVLRNLTAVTSINHTYNGATTATVTVYGNPDVRILDRLPEESQDEQEDDQEEVDLELLVPGPPRKLRLEAAGDGVDGRRSFTAHWDAPESEGDSEISGYTVTVSHPSIWPAVAAWRDSWEVSDRSFQFDHGDPGYTYTVSVRARNNSGSGPSASEEFTIRCLNGNKYEMKREGRVFKQWRVYALQDFRLVPNGWEIKQGYRGGVVFDEGSLSQWGCSWIYQDAAVEGNGNVSGNAVISNNSRVKDWARVSGNAVISNNAQIYNSARVYGNARVFGNAKVYDDAEVYGDTRVSNLAEVYGNAEVYDNAEVYGKARVYDNADVYGDADVEGNAKVYGYAKVYGTAVLLDGMEASCNSPGDDDCNYNGDIEYQRAARELYENAYREVSDDLTDCLSPFGFTSTDIEGYTTQILAGKTGTVSEALRQGCRVRDAIEEAKKILPEDWSIVLDLALGLFGASEIARLSVYLKGLILIVENAKSVVDFGEAITVLSSISENLKDVALEECRQNSRCRRLS